jgi:hypothetical protein
MPSIPQIVTAMQTVLCDQATDAARMHGLIRRHRRMSGAQFVQTVVGSFLAHPDATYETMVGVAADLGVTITPQGLEARFDPAAVACLHQVLAATMHQTMTADPAVLPLLDRFVAVEVQDSTTIALPDALADQFAGCGGSHGRVAAAVKAQFRWELRSGRLDGPLLQDGRASDRAVEFVRRAAPGTLRLRDLGYWHLDDLLQDAQDGRFWLTRPKPGTALTTIDGQRVALVDLLEAQTAEMLEVPIQLGARHRLPARLLARRLDPETVAARLRRVEQTARRKGRRVSATTRLLCAWEVLVTNLTAAQLRAHEAWILYGVRWQIELLFKLWKQSGKLDMSRGTQPARVLAELYAKFIGLVIQHWLLLAGCWQQADRSLTKAAKVVRAWAERLMRALTDTTRLEHLVTDLVAAIQRAGRQTRRKKQPGTWQLLGGQPSGLT